MFVLPNLFTISNIFCGFYSIYLSSQSTDPLFLYQAAISIIFGMFFDMADGRVARLTKTQSEFGVQLDSLADVITFGCAPALLLYRWTLHELGFVGLFIAFLFLASGTIRLARFNVMAADSHGASKDFLGLPIPLAAGAVVAIVMSNYPFEQEIVGGLKGVIAMTIILSLLMVSNVRYRAFKNVRANRRSIMIAMVGILFFAALSARLEPAMALVFLFGIYIADGLIEEVIFFRPRRAERQAEREAKRPKSAELSVEEPKSATEDASL
jgi:CDP-diacylglycerol--serine O-phosphatidyltransferase